MGVFKVTAKRDVREGGFQDSSKFKLTQRQQSLFSVLKGFSLRSMTMLGLAYRFSL